MSISKDKISLDVIYGINEILTPLGFKKSRLVWHKSVPDMSQLIWLERSRWYKGFYLRYGLCLNKKPRPTVNKIDVEWSTASKLPTERHVELKKVLNLDEPMEVNERLEVVAKGIRDYVLPAFDATNTLDKLRAILAKKLNPYYTSMTSFLDEEL